MNWYVMAMKKYAEFGGRSRRKEYWMYTLFQIIFAMVAMTLDGVLGLKFGILPYGWIYAIYALATFVPSLAVFVRRMHDINKSGWWFFIGLIPIIGAIWLLVLLCTDSDAGENKYGPNPKNVASFNTEALDSHLTN